MCVCFPVVFHYLALELNLMPPVGWREVLVYSFGLFRIASDIEALCVSKHLQNHCSGFSVATSSVECVCVFFLFVLFLKLLVKSLLASFFSFLLSLFPPCLLFSLNKFVDRLYSETFFLIILYSTCIFMSH